MKKNYEPKGIEKKIYENWESSGYFIASPDEKKKLLRVDTEINLVTHPLVKARNKE